MRPEDLRNHLEGACIRALRRQNSLAIAASGGLDSSVLAALIAEHAEIPITLVTAGAPGSVDAQRARLLSQHLSLPLIEVVLSPSRSSALLARVVRAIDPEPVDPERAAEWGLEVGTLRISPIRAAVGVVLLACADEASLHARRLVLGQGADELFGGYSKYARADDEELLRLLATDREAVQITGIAQEKKIAREAGIQFHYPYLDPAVVAFAYRLPLDALRGEQRKPLLRDVARDLGLPPEIVNAPKTAAQYGSGVADVVKLLAESSGQPQNDFLTQLAANARAETTTPSGRSA